MMAMRQRGKRMAEIRAIDLFCGAGGSSWGARLAGARIVAAFDRWPLAQFAYRSNFPEARVFPESLERVKPVGLARKLGNIDLILASPECTNHSPARGGKPSCERSRGTAFQVVRFAQVLKPRWIVVENVVSMRRWSRYDEFIDSLAELGYNVSEQALNAADFGVRQTRRRLFILCDLEKAPAKVTRTTSYWKSVRRAIDFNGTYGYSALRTERRARPTLERAERAIAGLGDRKPFILVYYGSDGAGGWQPLSRPLRTVTTLDRFALVRPNGSGHMMRMLQVPELKAAMGMPQRFQLGDGTRRDRIRMIGNAVCPPVMKAAVRALVGSH